MSVMSVRDNIRDGKYENKVTYSRKDEPVNDDMTIKEAREHEARQKELRQKQRNLYYAEEARMEDLLRQDLEEEHGMTGHPKAGKLFDLAWSYGHSSGYHDVVSHYMLIRLTHTTPKPY